ncbi:MAG: hypothetical protein ACLQVJ_24125 [Syntrophobacteraceae bacterium]
MGAASGRGQVRDSVEIDPAFAAAEGSGKSGWRSGRPTASGSGDPGWRSHRPRVEKDPFRTETT